MKTIVKTIFGSHLYGTDTEKSDKDFKGIYAPSLSDLIHIRYSDSLTLSSGNGTSKNTSADVDYQLFSLQYFGKLCERGDMIGFDVLHTPDEFVVECLDWDFWKYISARRKNFYSKNLLGYIGYISSQTNKYGMKGERVKVLETCLSLLESVPNTERLESVWNRLASIDGVQSDIRQLRQDKNGKMTDFLSIVGKLFDKEAPVSQVYSCLKNVYDSCGHRAKQAKENDNVDWKAISHAMRVCYQVEELLQDENITFPLKNATYIRDIKQGKVPFVDVSRELEEKKTLILKRLDESTWPEKPDMRFWEDIIDIYYYDIIT